MIFDIKDVKEAYFKLKSYIYYDTTDIILRRQLVEFESNRTPDLNFILGRTNEPYSFKGEPFNLALTAILDKKLEEITLQLNSYHLNPHFFDYFLEKIGVNLYPKKISSPNSSVNFVSNKRTSTNYELERVTAFIEAPIELHIVSVLWIMKYGYKLDVNLGSHCLGNRLLLDKDKQGVVKGSGLYKPYYKQYQKWRDDSVETARNLLNNEKNVLFLNLDVKDYFHSVRIPATDFISNEEDTEMPNKNLKQIFYQIHEKYSIIVSQQYNIPYNFYDELLPDEKGNLGKVILPIGLLSSYVLANHYLVQFDSRITRKIKPAYYGRYVDDILIVLSDPNPFCNDEDETFRFDYDQYFRKLKDNNELCSFTQHDLNNLESYIVENFHPIINLVDSPFELKNNEQSKCKEFSSKYRIFKINGYESLYCQSDKTVLFYFEEGESDLVIDKLKKELDEKTSEFRDFPDGGDDHSFEKNAYHLNYDGTDGKIRTLKDYSENRYGLTLYLSNKIFSALRQEKRITEKEKKQVQKFFRGSNCINFYRLWEKIFTFFLVNDEPDSYIDFYVHCVTEIDKIDSLENKSIDHAIVRNTLVRHLDNSHELAMCLNPKFIEKSENTLRNFEFKLNKISANSFSLFDKSIEPTKPDSLWFSRYRETNMLRHQYIIHPLLSYTNEARYGTIDLTNPKMNCESYTLNNELLVNSPRHIKYWECCLATALGKISKYKKTDCTSTEDYIVTDILEVRETGDKHHYKYGLQKTSFYLEDAFEIYEIGNTNHIPSYYFKDQKFKDNFFQRSYEKVQYDKIHPVGIQEVRVNTANRLNAPMIAFANTIVEENNIFNNLKKNTNLSSERYFKLMNILKKARQDNSDVLLFPECFIPVNLLSSIVRYAEKNDTLVITGLEHIVVDKTAFNYVSTILPVTVNGIKDATVLLRLKNHYAPEEEHILSGFHYNIPKPTNYRHDIINWKNIYLSTYYCFELANAFHRSLFKGKIDLMVGIEWNRDTPYFSNIVETCTRDLHIYFAQVNTSNYGDTRLTQPVETARKDILRLKGGLNDTILVGQVNLAKLREFQRKKFSLTHRDKEYKPLPPDYLIDDVLKRICNKPIL